MSLNCPNCGQDMPDNHPYTPIEVQNAVEDAHSWETIDYRLSTSTPQKAWPVKIRGKNAVVNVVEKIEPVDMPSNEYDRQGETYKSFLILEVDGSYYRKEAHVDSYAEATWSGAVTKVNRVEKMIQVWE